MKILNLPKDERPREKLLKQGPACLSDAELLAIFLRTGVPGKSAIDMARDLLRDFDGLRGLLQASQTDFCKAKGLGEAKYTQLQAMVEMARRHLLTGFERGDALESPNMVRDFLRAKLRDSPCERFVGLFLDNRHRLIRYEELFQGTIDSASVHPREVVRRALELNAAALIVAHNHPSGVSEPSQADIAITKRLKDALHLIEVRLLDHLVVGDLDVTSLAERGQM
jgi:DNA repair protein RadC